MENGLSNTPQLSPEEQIVQKKRIKTAFEIFDTENKGHVAHEDIPNMMQVLGLFPSMKEIVDRVLPEMYEENPNVVSYEKFEQVTLDFIASGEFLPAADNMLLQAFQVLDKENKGYITADKLRELMTSKGTPLREKEMDAMMSVAKDAETGRIYYEDYISIVSADVENARQWAT
eukprot:g4672.t1